MAALLDSLLARLVRPSRSLDQPRGYVGRTAAGIAMNDRRALQISTVWACHRYLTQTIGQLPVRVLRETRSGQERVRAHPVVNLLTWRPNPELAPFQLKETLVGWALMRGNGVAEIEFDMAGRAVALWPIEPDRVEFLRDAVTGELVYRIDNGDAGKVDLSPRQVFHLRGFGDGAVGLSVMEYAAQSMGWAAATELFGASYFGNGMSFGGVVTLTGKGDPKAITRMRAELEGLHRGPRKAGRWFFADSGAKLEKMTAAPDEAQFVETMQHQVEEMCRWFGVPPQKVFHLLRMTFNNVEQLSIEVVVDSVTPWCVRFEEEANYKLFGQNRAGHFVKLDLKGLLRGSFKERQEGLQIMRRNGVLNADTWAEVEDMDPPGTENGGDVYIVEANMTRAELVGETSAEPAPAPALGGDAGDDMDADDGSDDPETAAARAGFEALMGMADVR